MTFSPVFPVPDSGYVVTTHGFKKRVDALDTSFNDHKAAFKSKTTWEVFRALLVFHLCSVGPLVDNCEKVKNQSLLKHSTVNSLYCLVNVLIYVHSLQ